MPEYADWAGQDRLGANIPLRLEARAIGAKMTRTRGHKFPLTGSLPFN